MNESKHTLGKWILKSKVNEHGVSITYILKNNIEVGHIHTTYHPTIPYEVYWNDSKKSQRCMTENEGLEIVKAAIAAEKGD